MNIMRIDKKSSQLLSSYFDPKVIHISKEATCLQRQPNCKGNLIAHISVVLISFKITFMFFDQNKRKFNQEGFYLGVDQIERYYEYEYFWVDFYSHG
jgi:hypothetical protein